MSNAKVREHRENRESFKLKMIFYIVKSQYHWNYLVCFLFMNYADKWCATNILSTILSYDFIYKNINIFFKLSKFLWVYGLILSQVYGTLMSLPRFTSLTILSFIINYYSYDWLW